jgi:5-methylcytosine-specific restriction enzyme A
MTPPRKINLPSAPKGKCRGCKGDVPKGRYTWCSDLCVEQYKIRSDPGYVRSQLKNRDKGICAICGLDCLAFEKELKALMWSVGGGPWAVRDRKLELGIPQHRDTCWDADHIVPVVEGGGQCGLDGYRTLCWKCHKTVTADLARRRAESRRKLKEPGSPG